MEKFPEFIERPHRSPGARSQRRAGGERPGAHAEARAERRRNVAEKIAATGTAAVIGSGSGDIGPEPVTAGFALRIDALHRKAGQVFHFLSILGAGPDASASRRQLEEVLSSPGRPNPWWKKHLENPFQNKMLRASKPYGRNCAVSDLWCQEKRLQDIVVRLLGWGLRTGDLWKIGPFETASERGSARKSRGPFLRIQD